MPLYDDAGYLLDAMSRIVFDSGFGLLSVIHSFVQAPPHAPLSTITAMAGFWLIGPEPSSAYIANSWILLIYIGIILWASKPLGYSISRLLIVFIFLYLPASHAIINEFRPDLAAGLLFGYSSYLICTFDITSNKINRKIKIALLASFACIAKPTAIILTGPMLLIAMGLTCIRYGQLNGYTNIGKWLVPFLFPVLIILIPSIYFLGGHTYNYIIKALVTNNDVWKTSGDALFHLNFHLFGYGGKTALGPFIYIGICSYLLVIFGAIKAKSIQSDSGKLCYLIFLVILYCGMSQSSEKTIFQGSFFYFPFIIGAIPICSNLVLSLSKIQKKFFNDMGLIFSLISASFFLFFFPFASTYSSPPLLALDSKIAYANLISLLYKNTSAIKQNNICYKYKFRVTSTNPDPFPMQSALIHVAAMGINVEPFDTYFIRTAKEIDELTMSSDFVLAADPSMPGLNNIIPGYLFTEHIIQNLKQDPNFTHEIVANIQGFPLWLFSKKCP